MANELTLTANGAQYVVSAAPETALLYVLRNDLQLRGPHFGCGLAQCGACAVLVDGKEVRSCITPVSSVAGKSVLTIEGLAASIRTDGLLHNLVVSPVKGKGKSQCYQIVSRTRRFHALKLLEDRGELPPTRGSA